MRDFLLSPGFAGVAALAAAIIALGAVIYLSRRSDKRFKTEFEQRERQHHEAREAERHAATIERCWQRLKWLVETAGIEPTTSEGATLGLGPELALALLRGLLRDAEKLRDKTLVNAVMVYQNQFGLVLAQQGGPLSELAAAASASASTSPSPSADGKQAGQPAPSTAEKPDEPPTNAADETPKPAARAAAGEGRRHD